MSSQQEDFRCIAVDMGAGSIRVMLGIIDHNGISYEEIHRVNNRIEESGGHDRWEIKRISREIKKGITKAIERSENRPSSIGVDSWGVDYVLMDEKNELIEAPIAYRDRRTEGMMEQWKTLMPEMETFQRTGINFYIFNTLFQLMASRNSDAMKRASRILFIPCYINFLLSGKAHNELTISSTSQMLGIEGEQWDTDILDKLNLNKEMLGEVIQPGTRLGQVKIHEAGDTGLESVAVCGHDTAGVVAAIPVEHPDYVYISAGTWCIVGVESDKPLLSEKALQLGLTNERGYNNTYRTLKNIVGLWLLQGLKEHLPARTSFSDMEKMTLEGGTITHVIDPDDPGFYRPNDMKEAFDDFFNKSGQSKPDNFSVYLLCAYDSLCFSFRYHIEQLEQLSGKPIRIIHLVGGGSQSDYLNQRIATICDREVVSGPVEGATLGNILVQAIAMGKIKDLKEGRAMVRKSFRGKRYLPEAESADTKLRYKRFLELKEII